jgi:hypothetical protein
MVCAVTAGLWRVNTVAYFYSRAASLIGRKART